MNEAKQDMKNYADRGGCYRPRWITPSEICIILRKPNSLIALLFIPRLKTSKNMLTFVDVKFTSTVDV